MVSHQDLHPSRLLLFPAVMSSFPTDNGDLTNNQLQFAFCITHYVLQVIRSTDEFDKMFFTLSWQMIDYNLMIPHSLSVLQNSD